MTAATGGTTARLHRDIARLQAELKAAQTENAQRKSDQDYLIERLGEQLTRTDKFLAQLEAARAEIVELKARIAELEREGSESEMSELLRAVQYWQNRALDHAKAYDDAQAKIERGKDQFVHLVAISCIADSAEIADAAREGIRVLDP